MFSPGTVLSRDAKIGKMQGYVLPMPVTGTLRDIISFVSTLESLRYPVRVISFGLSIRQGGVLDTGVTSANITLMVLMLKEKIKKSTKPLRHGARARNAASLPVSPSGVKPGAETQPSPGVEAEAPSPAPAAAEAPKPEPPQPEEGK
jgi:hypothetical protein